MSSLLSRLLGMFGQAPADGMLDIAELKRRVDTAQGVVLDVRPAADFNGEEGHLASAVNIPLEELAGRVADIGLDYARPIAIVCRTDKRSARAAQVLAARGYGNARVVRGGMTAWRAQGWPLAYTTSVPSGRCAEGSDSPAAATHTAAAAKKLPS